MYLYGYLLPNYKHILTLLNSITLSNRLQLPPFSTYINTINIVSPYIYIYVEYFTICKLYKQIKRQPKRSPLYYYLFFLPLAFLSSRRSRLTIHHSTASLQWSSCQKKILLIHFSAFNAHGFPRVA